MCENIYLAASIFMSLYYMAYCREKPVLEFAYEVYFEHLADLFFLLICKFSVLFYMIVA